MTIQEEIGEGVRLIWNDYKFGETIHENSVWVVDAILSYLHSQGVVIKVRMKLPYSTNEVIDLLKGLQGGLDMPLMTPEYQVLGYLIEGLEVGYVATKPLIEEKK